MLDQKTLASQAFAAASAPHDEWSGRPMIEVRERPGLFPGREKRLTGALEIFPSAQQWPVPLGSDGQGPTARQAITECGKTLADGP
ncbi:hypothetical protein [Paenarthrobacter aurescens]|uniref:Uncharacterized protein n=1 Tax=Paenarthrobacter aurescens TaxID=43663 RepID=A0A4Y3NF30_PAEAU|nr:hypothetical protein [Paenarthrobacter aurescens]UKA50537.1 hypothetical protein LFT48_03050 [Arthrobacter sp. FW305-123]MDO6142238.1 hypothetical protein [Paenarthrobacter aurescens]MDO6146086.1 hypothetical protein [Paenarthrobacter aurescens]MDO6157330.1 hypothetical protein [Paenarthrobacter aurescens]MDO6161315.1 hypothetical protein [Paenarthrobacter aurescens]